jgi:hypothetical protein
MLCYKTKSHPIQTQANNTSSTRIVIDLPSDFSLDYWRALYKSNGEKKRKNLKETEP